MTQIVLILKILSKNQIKCTPEEMFNNCISILQTYLLIYYKRYKWTF